MSESLSAALALGGAAFVVALSGAMAPGPYLTVTITRTMTRGPLSAALMLVGHALLEGALLIGFAFGLQAILRLPAVATALALVGGAILIWMGQDLLRGAARGSIMPEADVAAPESRLGPIVQGITVSLSNPYWTLWWATIGVKLASDGLAIGPLGVVAFFIGHELADIAWYGFVITAVSRGRGLLAERPYRVVIGVCAAFLLYLGARFFIDGVGML
ncbi:MAG TPA: LysE family transporter [Coriobacteriia bacterium]|nr:LysE family transporter [Coriobacteriia bacterium]